MEGGGGVRYRYHTWVGQQSKGLLSCYPQAEFHRWLQIYQMSIKKTVLMEKEVDPRAKAMMTAGVGATIMSMEKRGKRENAPKYNH